MNRLINVPTIGLIATICGGLFIGYCFYFDKKRRSDPDYKKKVLERRKKKSEEEERNSQIVLDFNNPVEMQRYFLEELELGEELLRTGEIEECVIHLCNAVAVCPSGEQMIQTLQQSLPPPVFLLMLQKLPEVSRRFQIARGPPKIRVVGKSAQIEGNLDLE